MKKVKAKTLKNKPSSYASSYDEAVARKLQEWRQWTSDEAVARKLQELEWWTLPERTLTAQHVDQLVQNGNFEATYILIGLLLSFGGPKIDEDTLVCSIDIRGLKWTRNIIARYVAQISVRRRLIFGLAQIGNVFAVATLFQRASMLYEVHEILGRHGKHDIDIYPFWACERVFLRDAINELRDRNPDVEKMLNGLSDEGNRANFIDYLNDFKVDTCSHGDTAPSGCFMEGDAEKVVQSLYSRYLDSAFRTARRQRALKFEVGRIYS